VLPDITNRNRPYPASDIEIGADGRIYVGTTNNINGDGGSVILFSDSGTTGTWTKYDNYVNIIKSDPDYGYTGRVEIATAPSDANIVYGK
jgi:hypothetical protein